RPIREPAVAGQQQAKFWEFPSAMSMARLWHHEGKREEGCEFLAPVYGWCTQGFDTRDLKQAKALLGELQHRSCDFRSRHFADLVQFAGRSIGGKSRRGG